MPYKTNKDLPKSITDNLSQHGQSIFREAFNSALKQYGDEETAFKVAWSAVKHVYEKNENGK